MIATSGISRIEVRQSSLNAIETSRFLEKGPTADLSSGPSHPGEAASSHTCRHAGQSDSLGSEERGPV